MNSDRFTSFFAFSFAMLDSRQHFLSRSSRNTTPASDSHCPARRRRSCWWRSLVLVLQRGLVPRIHLLFEVFVRIEINPLLLDVEENDRLVLLVELVRTANHIPMFADCIQEIIVGHRWDLPASAG